MESLLQRMIDTYEDYLGIPEHDRTPAREISRRTENGIGIFDGEYNCYRIENFAVKCFFTIDDIWPAGSNQKFLDFTLTKCYDEFIIEKGGDKTATLSRLTIA